MFFHFPSGNLTGAVGGQNAGGGSSLTAPVLAWDGNTADATPNLTVDIDDTVGSGDNLRFEYDTSNTFPAATVVNHTISSGEDAANEIALSLSALGAGTYYVHVRGEKSGVGNSPFSNTVTVTITVAAPTNSVAPAVTGSGHVGNTLTSGTGTWANTPTGYTYQWQRGGVNIGGATSSTYALVTADASTNITCNVTASNAGGSNTATSNTVAVTAQPTLTYVTTVVASNVGAVATATAASIGTASASRRVLLVMSLSIGKNLSSVTIGGVSATIHGSSTTNNTAAAEVFFASAIVPTGTTGDIVITATGTLFSSPRVNIYTTDDNTLKNASPTVAKAEQAGGAITTTNVAVEAAGFIIAAGGWDNGSGKDPITCTGTETYTTTETGSSSGRGFYKNAASANASSTVTITTTGSFDCAIGALSWV